jgi:integrase
MKIRLPYLKTWVDKKSGITYARFRRKGYKQVQLPGALGSDEMLAAYWAARNCGAPVAPKPVGASRLQLGSVASVVGLFLESTRFTGDSESTQGRRRPQLNKFRELYGEMPMARLDGKFITRLIEDAGGGHAARNWLKAIRPLMQFAVAKGFSEADPTIGIKVSVPQSDGHATWGEPEIEQFRAHWAIGTTERLAMELALHTGQRISDLVRMGPQHVRNGILKIKQHKKTKAGRAEVEIPIHPALAALLAAPPKGMTFLRNAWERPFTTNSFSTWFSSAAFAAGLPQGYTAHGLRKGCCKRLADIGCTVTEIASITGHRSLKEIQHYTLAFDRRKAAKNAIAKLLAGGS